MLRSYHQRNLCPLPERTKGENHSQQHLGPDSRCRRRLRGLTWPRTGLCARATRRLVGQGRGLQEGWGEGRRTRTRRARLCAHVCARVCMYVYMCVRVSVCPCVLSWLSPCSGPTLTCCGDEARCLSRMRMHRNKWKDFGLRTVP